MNRTAFRWTFSSLSTSRAKYGSHTTAPYSSEDRTSVMNAIRRISGGQLRRFRFKKPRVDEALPEIPDMCEDHLRSVDICRPRYGRYENFPIPMHVTAENPIPGARGKAWPPSVNTSTFGELCQTLIKNQGRRRPAVTRIDGVPLAHSRAGGLIN